MKGSERRPCYRINILLSSALRLCGLKRKKKQKNYVYIPGAGAHRQVQSLARARLPNHQTSLGSNPVRPAWSVPGVHVYLPWSVCPVSLSTAVQAILPRLAITVRSFCPFWDCRFFVSASRQLRSPIREKEDEKKRQHKLSLRDCVKVYNSKPVFRLRRSY